MGSDSTELCDAGRFLPDWDPFILDYLLTGQDEGPLADLIVSGETGCDHPVDLDWSTHVCPPAILPAWAVRLCHDRISKTAPHRYSSLEALIAAGWLSGYSRRDQEAHYENLVECAAGLRHLIAETALRGCPLQCSMR